MKSATDAGWDDDNLNSGVRQLTGADFEAVDTSGLMTDVDSAAARQ